MNKNYYKNKKVFVTGHTGFKGSWMCKVLLEAGADVMGYSLEPDEEKILFEVSGIKEQVRNTWGDIRDYDKVSDCMKKYSPDIVIHMAAQPIVRESYKNPVYTYSTNVMGTVNILDSARWCESVSSIVNVTTDKVYENDDRKEGYIESDRLNGYDPYSNSKSCSELVTSSYINSFFKELEIPVSTCRAGNVIGGGDFSKDRIIPDCFRAAANKNKIVVRNPNSIRPYQHVLDPVVAYLMLAHVQSENPELAGNYNIGPDDKDNKVTADLVNLFCDEWGDGASWETVHEEKAPHESSYLFLDCAKANEVLKWNPIWNIENAIKSTVEWYKVYQYNKNEISSCMLSQIEKFYKDGGRI